MAKLHHQHHNLIMLCMVLFVLITGMIFGIKLSSATAGTDGLIIIIFALSFLSIMISFLIFTQIIHIREQLEDVQRKKR